MARKTKEEAEKTRAALLDAAETVFYKRGVVRTSLQEVADEAGLTRGAVYWHFKNKIELLRAMADRVVLPQEQILQRLEASGTMAPLEDLKNACLEGLRQLVHDPRRHRVLSILTQRCEYTGEMADMMQSRRETRERILGHFVRLFERAHRLKHLSPGWPPRTAAAALHGLIFGLLFQTVADGFDAVPAFVKANEACITALFRSFMAEPLRSREIPA